MMSEEETYDIVEFEPVELAHILIELPLPHLLRAVPFLSVVPIPKSLFLGKSICVHHFDVYTVATFIGGGCCFGFLARLLFKLFL